MPSTSASLLPCPVAFAPRIAKFIPFLRRRTTLLAFLALITLCVYTILLAPPALELTPVAPSGRVNGLRNPVLYANLQHNPPAKYVEPWTLSLSPKQELAALCSFIGALASNALPLSVDPAEPLDPQLVLEFDFMKRTEEDVREELEYIVSDVWERYPVVVFSKSHNSVSRGLKALLNEMDIRPLPKIFDDVDSRSDAEVLLPLLHRLTSSSDLPLLLVGGEPIGSLPIFASDDATDASRQPVGGNLDLDHLRDLQKSGELKQLIQTAGARVLQSPAGRKKGKNAH